MKHDCIREGWIKFYRCTMDSTIWRNEKYLKVFLWCIFKANHTENGIPFNGKDIIIKKGQFITGMKEAVKELKPITVSTYRNALTYLKSTHRINIQTTNKFSIITVCNYELYQGQKNESSTLNQQTNDKPTTNQRQTNNNKQEYKNNKKEKEILKEKDFFEKNAREKKALPKLHVSKSSDETISLLAEVKKIAGNELPELQIKIAEMIAGFYDYCEFYDIPPYQCLNMAKSSIHSWKQIKLKDYADFIEDLKAGKYGMITKNPQSLMAAFNLYKKDHMIMMP